MPGIVFVFRTAPGGVCTEHIPVLDQVGRESKVSQLETFPNQYEGREYEVSITCPEFTAVCPRTGQPDFATIRINYVPDKRIVELKSLKLYLFSYRQEGIFHEHVTNKILDDFVAACEPIRCEVVGDFNLRGGIKTVVRANYDRSDA